MERIPNEILLKIFSYLRISRLWEDVLNIKAIRNLLNIVSQRFRKNAYEKALWLKLPIDLSRKQVPVKSLQHIHSRLK